MKTSRFDVLGIGNAIVDTIVEVDDAFLTAHDLMKGTMQLADESEAERIHELVGAGTKISGGSVANTMAGLASIGGRAAFIGRVRDDELGRVFMSDLANQGVEMLSSAAQSGPSTAHSLVMSSPDHERTMVTCLGASAEMTTEFLDAESIRASSVLFLEGYLWDLAESRELMVMAAEMAAASDRKVAMSLADPSCVLRHHADIVRFLRDHVDIVLANEAEAIAFAQASSFDHAARHLAELAEVSALTRGANGSVIVFGETHVTVDAVATAIMDTTGAGDAYAAGFLYGYTQGTSLERAGRIGSVCAAEVISHFGARVESDITPRIITLLNGN